MERYIKLLFVALFATMSCALTSCGDDNDEPDDPNNISLVAPRVMICAAHEALMVIRLLSGNQEP